MKTLYSKDQETCAEDIVVTFPVKGCIRYLLRSDKEVYHVIYYNPHNDEYFEYYAEDWRKSFEKITKERAEHILTQSQQP